MSAWNAASHVPPAPTVMAGLVPAIMPKPNSVAPLTLSYTQRLPVGPWNATAYPPLVSPVMLGLVPAIMANPVLVAAALV